MFALWKKHYVKKPKRQVTAQEKRYIWQMICSAIRKQQLLHNSKTNNPTGKKWAKYLNRRFTKDSLMSDKHMKRCWTSWVTREMQMETTWRRTRSRMAKMKESLRPVLAGLGARRRLTVSCCCFCSAAQSYPALCEPVDASTLGSPVLHHLPEFAQTHVQGVEDAIRRMRWLDGIAASWDECKYHHPFGQQFSSFLTKLTRHLPQYNHSPPRNLFTWENWELRATWDPARDCSE